MSRNRIRKRYFVSEGELFRLYAEIMEVRNGERREAFRADFRRLMKESEEVELVVKEKKGGNGHGTL